MKDIKKFAVIGSPIDHSLSPKLHNKWFKTAEIESKFLPNNKGRIYNLYTQSGYSTKKREVNYEYFWKALKNMQEDLLFIQHETGEQQVLGLPYGISCGLAGGNWKIIKAMIEDIFLDSLIKTYIVEFDLT